MTHQPKLVELLFAKIARGELESQASQTCEHKRESVGGGMSGFCLDCGEDLMVLRVNQWLAEHAANDAAREERNP